MESSLAPSDVSSALRLAELLADPAALMQPTAVAGCSLGATYLP